MTKEKLIEKLDEMAALFDNCSEQLVESDRTIYRLEAEIRKEREISNSLGEQMAFCNKELLKLERENKKLKAKLEKKK